MAARHETDPELRLLGERPPVLAYLRDVWRRRAFATAIAVGEVRSQNMDTVLGNLWHVLNPLLLAGVYYLVFGVVLDVTRGVENFMAFLVVGVFVFHFSQKSIIGGAKSIVSNEGLIRSVRFPRATLPIATVLGQCVAFLPAIGVMLVIALLRGEQPNWQWFLLLPVLSLQVVFNIGAAFVLARATDAFHDVQNVLPYVFRLLFYGSGVLYSVERFTDDAAVLALFDFNPFYVFISLVRGPILAEMTLDPRLLLIGFVWAVAALVFGFFYFRAGEDRYGRG